MGDLRASTHAAACAAVRSGRSLDSLLTRGEQRRLVREARDWYLDTYTGNVTRQGTCVVATAGPPGAGKSSILPAAIPDLDSRLVIDPDTVKDYLGRWCTEHAAYADLLATALPDGGTLRPLELSPLLQTMSTEVANAVRRDALAQHMDIVVEATMASPAYGERLLLSLAKADYQALLIVSVETNRQAAQTRAVERWWTGRRVEPKLGGRLVLPETIDAAYTGTRSASACRTNARNLAGTIRAGGTAIEHVTIAEYDDGALARLDADPPRQLDA